MRIKSGYVSVTGKTNTGKSTLLNSILGEKIAITSSKPQTTRNRILGVKTTKDEQIIFLDTPGIHHAHSTFNQLLVKTAFSTYTQVDLILYVVDSEDPFSHEESIIIKNLKHACLPTILCLNKIDKVKKSTILPLIDALKEIYDFKEIIPISALKKDGIEQLLQLIIQYLPFGPQYFPEDFITDLPERFLATEIIREKLFNLTHQEIPYSTFVVIESFKENQEKELVCIEATIIVERESQKGIVIGKGGKKLKMIGEMARREIEHMIDSKVFLRLWVKVDKNWTKNPRALREFGYV